MSLSKQPSVGLRGVFWEVDGSGLLVYRARAQQWILAQHPSNRDYLSRHGLASAVFKTRARAVDAIRMALSRESRVQAPPRTRWVRQGEGEYLSRDGHWRLRREKLEERISPASERARTGMLREMEEGDLTQPYGRATLLTCARYADRLSEMFGLERA